MREEHGGVQILWRQGNERRQVATAASNLLRKNIAPVLAPAALKSVETRKATEGPSHRLRTTRRKVPACQLKFERGVDVQQGFF